MLAVIIIDTSIRRDDAQRRAHVDVRWTRVRRARRATPVTGHTGLRGPHVCGPAGEIPENMRPPRNFANAMIAAARAAPVRGGRSGLRAHEQFATPPAAGTRLGRRSTFPSPPSPKNEHFTALQDVTCNRAARARGTDHRTLEPRVHVDDGRLSDYANPRYTLRYTHAVRTLSPPYVPLACA